MLFSAFEGLSDDASAGPGKAADDSRKRVLIVESDGPTANDITAILDEAGYATELAADARTALLELNEFLPDLVLLGTYLADMPGYELTAILRAAPQYAWRFRTIGLLYVADRHKLLKHRLVGAPEVPLTKYIFKPINKVELLDKVARTLDEITPAPPPTPFEQSTTS
jgi:PleD family two-component response regulator